MAVAPPYAPAQPVGNDWIGKRVVQKYSDFVLKNDDHLIGPKSIAIYRVEQVNGPSLRLLSPQLSGCAPADQVVLVEQAIEFFTNSIRLDPGDAFLYTTRSIIWLREKKDLHDALADLNEAIRLEMASAALHNIRGNAWRDNKEYDEAIADYNEASRVNSNDFYAYFALGAVWQDKKEWDKSIASFDQAIRLDPMSAVAFAGRGRDWTEKKAYDKAIADCDHANSARSEPRLRLQRARLGLGRQEGKGQGDH
jgi:tetratricopeptide (TPR) repeat protein